MIEASIGLTLGAATLLLARLIRGEHWFYPLGLIALPLIYLGFALYAGEDSAAVLELLWGLPYLIGGALLALGRVPRLTILVGAFWLLHGVYDLLHGALFHNAGVPPWYPVFCAAVDIVVGLYLLALSRRLPRLQAGPDMAASG